MKLIPLTLSLLGSAALVVPNSFGQIVYSDNFDVDNTANWVVNKSTGVNLNDAGSSANFFYDYSALSIPSAPNSTGGSTRGMQLRANMSGNIFSGLSVSPLGEGFSGDYVLRFDMWLNYNGRLDGGGNGTTQLAGAGVGTSGTTAQWAGFADGVWFASTPDGGSASDYRAYSPLALTGYASGNAVYSAPSGLINNSGSYYTTAFPAGQTAPAGQVVSFPQQTNGTLAGTIAFKWRDVVITKTNNFINWSIDGVSIATVNATAMSLSTNILFTYFDSNAASSTDLNAPNLLFGLYDNITVTLVPEPSVAVLTGLGLVALVGFARRRKR